MSSYRLIACAALCLMTATHASAQKLPADADRAVEQIAPETGGPTSATPPSSSSAPAPLNLRGGAVPTGLSGFYDYQSNGMSPGYIVVSPANPDQIHTTTMLSTANTDAAAISASRKVGYAYSSDGGATWVSNKAVGDLRLGYPYLQVMADNNAILSAHGDDGVGLRTLFYVGQAIGDAALVPIGGTELETSSGRTEGVIWPTFVVDPDNPTKIVTAASLSFPTGTQPAPLQVTIFDIDQGTSAPWRQIAADSLVSTSSGGRYVMARSAEGKIGVAYHHYANATGDIETPGVYLTESTDGGQSWSTPEHVMPITFSDEYMTNGDQDTVNVGPNVDLVYKGEEPHIVTNGNTGGLYISNGIYYWSRATGAKRIVVADSTIGLGLQRAVNTKAQPNMSYVSYPTLSVGKTGVGVIVAFQAAAQRSVDEGAVVSEEGFNYFRLWGIGSRDGGATWGRPFIIQDFAGDGTDSANIDYPSAAEISQIDEAGNLILDLTFQARRSPGMYAFTVADVGGGVAADAGPINETFQYFQRVTVTPQMMGAPASVGTTAGAGRSASVAVHPSHTTGVATLGYTLATSGPLSIGLYDNLGTEVMRVADVPVAAAGSYTRAIDLSKLPVGVYRVVLTQNGVPVSTPVVVVR